MDHALTNPTSETTTARPQPAAPGRFGDLSGRVVTGIVAVPILIALTAWSPVGFLAIMAVAAGLGAFELTNLLRARAQSQQRPMPAYAGPMAILAGLLAVGVLAVGALAGPIWLGAGALLAAIVAIPRTRLRAPALAAALVAPAAFALYWVRADAGAWWVLLAFVTTWIGDAGAYFVGKRFGRRKLAPVVSPNKTIEGALGGLALSALLGATMGPLVLDMDWAIAGLVAGGVNVVGQAGDLLESRLKRARNVKDSGRSIPGYGGMLDKVDSLLVAAPVIAAAVLLLN